MDVSIIIVNYNTRELILNCLATIYKFTCNISLEIIVVDNSSSDDSIFHISDKYPEVIIIQSQTNLGFGKANNLGVKNAKGEFIFLLNSDTLLIENSIKKLYDFSIFQKDKIKLGVLGCVLLDEKLKETNSAGFFPTINQYIENYFYRLQNLFYRSEKNAYKSLVFEEATNVDMVSGADMFMKKEIFDLVNGFDENFFLYYEESDLQFRLKNLGFLNIVINSTNIVHLEGGSSMVNNAKRIIIKKSQNFYFKKNDKNYYYKYILFEFLMAPFSFLNSKYTFQEQLIYTEKNFKTLL